MIVRRGNDPTRWENHGPVAPYSPRSYGGASGAVGISDMKPVLSSNGGNVIPANNGRRVEPMSIRPENRR